MSDFNYGGTDEESAEIKKLNAEVVSILKASYVTRCSVANMRAARGYR